MKIDLIFPRWQIDLSKSGYNRVSEGVGRMGCRMEVGVGGVKLTAVKVGVGGVKLRAVKVGVVGIPETTKEVETTRAKPTMPKTIVIGTTAMIEEVEPKRTKRITSKAAALGTRKAGAMMSEKTIFGSQNSTGRQIENPLRKSLNTSPLTLRSDVHCK